jgi:hypothetical protein
MKITRIALLAAALLLPAALPATAQDGPTCNENQAEGIARSELSTCIADAQRDGFIVSLETVCNCPGTGYTVTAIGTLRCRPNEPCPRIARLVGTVQLDCNLNVISSTCGVPEG